MKKKRYDYRPDEKVAILKRHLVDQIPVSDLCDQYNLLPFHIATIQAGKPRKSLTPVLSGFFFKRQHRSSTNKKGAAIMCRNPFIFLVRQEGFEPPTHGLEGRCSIQLSYWRRDFLCVANVAVLFQKGKLSLHKASFSCAKPSCQFCLQSRLSKAHI